MNEIKKIIKPMLSEIRQFVALENVSVEGIDNIPQKNRITKGERELQLSFDAVLNKELHKIVDNPSLGEVLYSL